MEPMFETAATGGNMGCSISERLTMETEAKTDAVIQVTDDGLLTRAWHSRAGFGCAARHRACRMQRVMDENIPAVVNKPLRPGDEA
jgi:hypothetical protein